LKDIALKRQINQLKREEEVAAIKKRVEDNVKSKVKKLMEF
jgi:hypothetical protein